MPPPGCWAWSTSKSWLALPPDEQIVAARKIVDAKREHGKTASLKHLDPKYRRKFGYRKSKAEINNMVAKMLGRGITGWAADGRWCAGYISDAELEEDIQAATLTEHNRCYRGGA